MCGHAGFARQPGHSDIGLIRKITEELIRGVAHRGKHATGIATVGGSNPFIWKWAVDPERALASEPWRNLMNDLAHDTPIGMAHVRYATQNNGHLDAAAHPFRIGRVTGAHNGVIRNWHDLRKKVDGGDRWIVDSEAVFALLDKHEDPNEALDHLNGYWALVWTKGGKLHFVRDNQAPLGVAYVPELRTMFWCSELAVLRRILARDLPGDMQFDAWEARPRTIYQFDVSRFDEEGTNSIKIDATFRGQSNNVELDWRTNGGFSNVGGNRSEMRALGPGKSKRKSDRRRVTSLVPEPKKGAPRALTPLESDGIETRAGVSMIGMSEVVKQLVERVNLLGDLVDKQAQRIAELETEQELMDGRMQVAESEVAHAMDCLAELDQHDLAEPECKECGRGERNGVELLSLPCGNFICTECIGEELPLGRRQGRRGDLINNT